MPRKTVLITGASRGIGKAIAVKFAREQYNIAISCISREPSLMEVKEEIQSCGVPCLTFLGDAGNMEHCTTMFSQIKNRFGTLDVLVNNAGVSYIGLLQDMTSEDWDRIIRTNLTSVFNCCKLAVPDMVSRKQGKTIRFFTCFLSVFTKISIFE